MGAGATGAILASRWTKKQARRVAPSTIARETKGGLMDLSKLLAESIQEGKRAMDERERELRSEYGLPPTGPGGKPGRESSQERSPG